MKNLQSEQMESIQGGTNAVACAATVVGGVSSIFGLAAACCATGVGVGFGIVLAGIGLVATIVGGAGSCPGD